MLDSKQVTTTWHDKKQALFGYLKIIIEWIFFVKTHKHISVFVAKKAEVEECMLEYTFLETFTDYFFRWEKLIARIFLIGKKYDNQLFESRFQCRMFFYTDVWEKQEI